MSSELLHRRRLMMQQGGGLEYISIPAGGYIMSGENARGSLKVEIKFAINEIAPAWVFGSRISRQVKNFGFLNQPVERYGRFAYGAKESNIEHNTISDTLAHTIIMDKGKNYMDNTLYSSYAEESFEGIEMLIGAFLNNEIINADTSHKIYYMKIWDNNVLVKDFVPMLYNGEYGLWDNVDGAFHRNAGTGIITGA